MYRIFDISLDSDIPLPELPESGVIDDDFILPIRIGDENATYTNRIIWSHDWKDNDDETFLACGSVKEGTLLRFTNLVDFVISSQLDSIEYYPEAATPAQTLRHLLLDQVVPRILGQRGKLVLHASAVILKENTGIIFVGDSGWGKSTLASSFHQSGKRLITDDCLLLSVENGEVFSVPNYYGVRLFQDSVKYIFKGHDSTTVAHYIDKKRVTLKDQDTPDTLSEVKLSAIILLGKPEQKAHSININIQEIKGASQMMTLFEQIFIMDICNKELASKLFKQIGKITETKLPVYSIQYPREYKKLREVREAIELLLD